MKKKIIFGASTKGKEALNYYGKDNVLYFCDNDCEKIGKYIEDKKIICIHELYKIQNDADIIIASAYEDEIIKQLQINNISKYSIFNEKVNECHNKINLDLQQICKIIDNHTREKKYEHIEIRIFYQEKVKWRATKELYMALLNDMRCEVKIIALPINGEKEWNILDKENIEYIKYYEYDMKDDVFDIAIYSSIDEISRPIQFNSYNVGKKSKIVYFDAILHNPCMNKKWIQNEMNSEIFTDAWKVLLGNKDQYEYINNNTNNNENKVFLLNPRWDNLHNELNKEIEIPLKWRNKIKNKKVILWNPQFYIKNENATTFHIYIKYMINKFIDNKKYTLIIRPHPSLFYSMIEQNICNKGDITKLKRVINESENLILDESYDYINAYNASNMIISDMSTLLFSYLITQKPIIYLQNLDEEEIMDDSLLKVCYKARNNADIDNLLIKIFENDSLYYERKKFIDKHIGVLTGDCAYKVKEYIINEYITQKGR